jgi:hypothetical protein
VREAVRKTMQSKPVNFESRELMLKYVAGLVKKKFGMDAAGFFQKSILLRQISSQAKLANFF